MLITSFQIERFGSLREQSVEGLVPGLNIILGHNEAGKSTSLNFFRAILFSYQRERKNKFEPKAEANRGGGSLWLQSRDFGLTRLLRRPGTHGGKAELFDAQGNALSESALERLLHGISPNLFDNVYGFSLQELQALKTLEGDEISRVFSGAMSGLGKISPADAIKKINAEMLELHSPRSGSISRLVTELEELRRKIQNLGPGLPRYLALGQEKKTLEEEYSALSTDLKAWARQKSDLALLRVLHPKWRELCSLRESVNNLPDPRLDLADDAIQRLEGLLSQEEERSLGVSKKERELHSLRMDLEKISAELAPCSKILDEEGAILRLVENKGKYSRVTEELASLNSEQSLLREKLRDSLDELGPDWSLERVRNFDRSLAKREHISRRESSMLEAIKALDAAKAEEVSLSRSIEEIRSEQRDSETRLNTHKTRMLQELAPFSPEFFSPDRLRNLDSLDKMLGQARNRLPDQKNLAERLQNDWSALQQGLMQTNPAWNAETLETLDFSPQARQTTTRKGAMLHSAEIDFQEAQRAHDNAAARYDEQSKALEPSVAQQQGFRVLPLLALFLLIGAIGLLATGFYAERGLLVAGFYFGRNLLGFSGMGLLIISTLVAGVSYLEQAMTKAALNRELIPLQERFEKRGLALQDAEKNLNEATTALESVQQDWAEHLKALGLAPALTPAIASELLNEGALLRDKLQNIRALVTQWRTGQSWLHDFFKQARSILREDLVASLGELSAPDAKQNFVEQSEREEMIFTRLFDALEETKRARTRLERALQQTEQLQEADLSNKKRLERQEKALTEARQQVANCEKTLQESRQAWSAWLQAQGLRPDLSADSARQAFGLIATALEVSRALQDKAENESKLQAWRTSWLLGLSRLSGLEPTQLGSDEQALRALDQLREKADSTQKLLTRREELLSQEKKVHNTLQDDSESLCATRTKLAELLQSGRADTHERFRSNFAAMRELRETKKALERAQAELQNACAGSALVSSTSETDEASSTPVDLSAALAPGGALAQRLEAINMENLEQEIYTLEEQLEKAQEQTNALAKRQGELGQEIRSLESGNRIAELRLREEQLREELAQLSEQWVRLNIAKSMLSQTKRRLEEERLPGLLTEAGEVFSLFTNGAYSKLSLSMDESTLSAASVRAVTSQGDVLSHEALSQGTKEQLYLSLRLAYIREHAKHSDPLPLFMDDILVNFDPKRAGQSAKALANLSLEGQQIFFFTCHPHTAEILQQSASSAAFFRLDKGQFAKI